jgi:hypothetical protein
MSHRFMFCFCATCYCGDTFVLCFFLLFFISSTVSIYLPFPPSFFSILPPHKSHSFFVLVSYFVPCCGSCWGLRSWNATFLFFLIVCFIFGTCTLNLYQNRIVYIINSLELVVIFILSRENGLNYVLLYF